MMATAHNIVDYSANPNPRVSCDVEIPDAISSLAAWKEFYAGMQILQRYAGRSSADVHLIAKSNLQLLHRSLSYDSLYRNSIESILREGDQSSPPTSRRLYSNQGLTADLLPLQDGASIKLMTLPQHYTMYLLISGNAQLHATSENDNPVVQHWWKRLGAAGNKNHLRNGAAIICAQNKGVGQLTANGKNCLVLKINAPAAVTACKIAS